MIRPIVTDKEQLALVSKPVPSSADIDQMVLDLLDTAEHWANTKIGCLGLAANQIGYFHRIIVIKYGNQWLPMINPSFVPHRVSKLKYGHEACLSRPGVNAKIKRHKRIEAHWRDRHTTAMTCQTFTGMNARIIQHEVDHLDGVFINN